MNDPDRSPEALPTRPGHQLPELVALVDPYPVTNVRERNN